MERFTFSDLLQHLEGFDTWLVSLGLTPRSNDRIHQAIQALERAEEASRKGRETGHYKYIQPEDWFPVVEALEALDVLTAFRDDPSLLIKAALKRALSGPAQPSDENPRNRDGRNIWFELALAAEWKLGGASVRLGEPDLLLERNGISFLIACKRPSTMESIEANLRDATKQLQRTLDDSPGSFGVAAISVNCAFNPGDKVFTGEIDGLGELVGSVLAQHRTYLQSIGDPRICCVLFQVTTPGIGDGVDLLRASFIGAQEMHPSTGSSAFAEHLRDIHGNTSKRQVP